MSVATSTDPDAPEILTPTEQSYILRNAIEPRPGFNAPTKDDLMNVSDWCALARGQGAMLDHVLAGLVLMHWDPEAERVQFAFRDTPIEPCEAFQP